MKLDEDLYIDFASLKDNADWKKIYSLYLNHIEMFSNVIENITIKYKMTKIQARDALIYELMSCHYKRVHRKKLFEKNKYKWSLIFITTILAVFFNSLISLFISNKKIKKDILFEEMFAKSGWTLRFYRYINVLLSNDITSKAILYIHPGINKDFLNNSIEEWEGEVINRRYSSIIFNFKESLFVVCNELFYFYKLFKYSNDINITYIYLRFLRKYLVYSSQIYNIEAKILVAAGDYYWNPVKYFVYKKNIKNIILLQHNFKNEYLHNRLFQYSDYYYAHSSQAIEKLEGIPFTKKYSIGSFQLVPFLESVPLEYDIMFINQTVNDDLTNAWPDLNQEKLIESYSILIENFKLYLKQNNEMKAIYVAKGESIDSEPSLTVKENFKKLRNIEFAGTYGPETFELVKKSKLIINMYSSVGFEAYGFDKKVLWVNYDRYCDIFKYDTEIEDLHVMIDDNSYKAFEKRINLLLSENKEVNEHYKKLKEKYMNINENPAKVVADKVLELLKVESV